MGPHKYQTYQTYTKPTKPSTKLVHTTRFGIYGTYLPNLILHLPSVANISYILLHIYQT